MIDKYYPIFIFLSAALSSIAGFADQNYVYLPRGCHYTELKNATQNDPVKLSRLHLAIKASGSAPVPKNLTPKSVDEKLIARKDLDTEILYYSNETKKCEYRFLKDTPYGLWIKKNLDWRKQQSLTEVCISRPVEVWPIYTVQEWRALPIGVQANIFDRMAADGYCKQHNNECHTEYNEDDRMSCETDASGTDKNIKTMINTADQLKSLKH